MQQTQYMHGLNQLLRQLVVNSARAAKAFRPMIPTYKCNTVKYYM